MLLITRRKEQYDQKRYEVWVGGTVVNDYNLSYEDAKDLATEYQDDGYDDVRISKVWKGVNYEVTQKVIKKKI